MIGNRPIDRIIISLGNVKISNCYQSQSNDNKQALKHQQLVLANLPVLQKFFVSHLVHPRFTTISVRQERAQIHPSIKIAISYFKYNYCYSTRSPETRRPSQRDSNTGIPHMSLSHTSSTKSPFLYNATHTSIASTISGSNLLRRAVSVNFVL